MRSAAVAAVLGACSCLIGRAQGQGWSLTNSADNAAVRTFHNGYQTCNMGVHNRYKRLMRPCSLHLGPTKCPPQAAAAAAALLPSAAACWLDVDFLVTCSRGLCELSVYCLTLSSMLHRGTGITD